MLAVCHAGKRREGLALAAGAEDHDLLVRDLLEVIGIDDVVIGNPEIAQLAGDLGVCDHRAARHDHLAANGHRGVADLLESVDVARERGDEDAARRVLDDVSESWSDGSLGRSEAGARGVG